MLAIFQTLLIRACSMISALAIPSQSDKRQKCVTFFVFFSLYQTQNKMLFLHETSFLSISQYQTAIDYLFLYSILHEKRILNMLSKLILFA